MVSLDPTMRYQWLEDFDPWESATVKIGCYAVNRYNIEDLASWTFLTQEKIVPVLNFTFGCIKFNLFVIVVYIFFFYLYTRAM